MYLSAGKFIRLDAVTCVC